MHLIEHEPGVETVARRVGCPKQTLTVTLGAFAARAFEREAATMGVSAPELANYALLYYLADLDSGRIARKAPHISACRQAPG